MYHIDARNAKIHLEKSISADTHSNKTTTNIETMSSGDPIITSMRIPHLQNYHIEMFFQIKHIEARKKKQLSTLE